MLLTQEQQKKRDEILARINKDGITDELFQALKKIDDEARQLGIEREGNIQNVVDGIRQIEPRITFAELMAQAKDGKPLFDSTEIMDYARGQGWKMPGATSSSVQSADGATKTRKTRTTKEGTILFEIQPPKAKGAATRILKGDPFPALGIGTKLVWLFQQEGDLAENLMARKANNPEVDAYLATDEGKAEFQKWVKYIAENAPKKLGQMKNPQNPMEEDDSDTRESAEANQNNLVEADEGEGTSKKSRKK